MTNYQFEKEKIKLEMLAKELYEHHPSQEYIAKTVEAIMDIRLNDAQIKDLTAKIEEIKAQHYKPADEKKEFARWFVSTLVTFIPTTVIGAVMDMPELMLFSIPLSSINGLANSTRPITKLVNKTRIRHINGKIANLEDKNKLNNHFLEQCKQLEVDEGLSV